MERKIKGKYGQCNLLSYWSDSGESGEPRVVLRQEAYNLPFITITPSLSLSGSGPFGSLTFRLTREERSESRGASHS